MGERRRESPEEWAWMTMFAAHPVELHGYDPERFWRTFQRFRPDMTREQMETVLECVEALTRQAGRG